MTRKIKVFFIIFISILGIVGLSTFTNQNNQKVEAKSIYSVRYWGATKKFTTPKALRGTWYYVNDAHELEKVRITTHKWNTATLYKALSDKQSEKFQNKYDKLSVKTQDKLANWFDKHALETVSEKWHGIKGINIHTWLVGEGGGAQYMPVTRRINGKKVKAIRIGGGAKNYFTAYAYHTKTLARKDRK